MFCWYSIYDKQIEVMVQYCCAFRLECANRLRSCQEMKAKDVAIYLGRAAIAANERIARELSNQVQVYRGCFCCCCCCFHLCKLLCCLAVCCIILAYHETNGMSLRDNCLPLEMPSWSYLTRPSVLSSSPSL